MRPSRPTVPAPEFLPSFLPTPGDPALPDAGAAIRLATKGIEGTSERPRWPLHGTFRVPRASTAAEPEQVLRHIVLVVTSASSHAIQAHHAFRDEVLFPEDVRLAGEWVTGAFHVDLLRSFEFADPREDYFVVASIGDVVSEPVRCEASMPWLERSQRAVAPEPPEPADEDEGDGGDDDDGEEDDGSWMVDEPL